LAQLVGLAIASPAMAQPVRVLAYLLESRAAFGLARSGVSEAGMLAGRSSFGELSAAASRSTIMDMSKYGSGSRSLYGMAAVEATHNSVARILETERDLLDGLPSTYDSLDPSVLRLKEIYRQELRKVIRVETRTPRVNTMTLEYSGAKDPLPSGNPDLLQSVTKEDLAKLTALYILRDVRVRGGMDMPFHQIGVQEVIKTYTGVGSAYGVKPSDVLEHYNYYKDLSDNTVNATFKRLAAKYRNNYSHPGR
jgi:hypothetical protein